MNSRPLTGTIDEEEIRMHLKPQNLIRYIREILARGRCAVSIFRNGSSCRSSVKLCSKNSSCCRTVKNKIYGRRIVLFAPLCLKYMQKRVPHCGFRAGNGNCPQKLPSKSRMKEDLTAKGHKRLLLVGK